jgi:hypothetical protein
MHLQWYEWSFENDPRFGIITLSEIE